jgi:hypothetical protein
MRAKRLVSETDKDKFIQDVLSFVSEKEWSISSVMDAISEVIEHMENNAVLKEEPMLNASAQ